MAQKRLEKEEDEEDRQREMLARSLSRNLEERKRLANESVQRLYNRRTLEQGFLECFELIGGVPRLAIWANDPENYGDFLKLLMKFAPKEAIESAGRVINYQSNVPHSPLNRDEVIEVENDPQ